MEPLTTRAMPTPITAASDAWRPTFSAGVNSAFSTVTRLPETRARSADSARRRCSRPSALAAFTVVRAVSTRCRSAPKSPMSSRLARAARRSARASHTDPVPAIPRHPTAISSNQRSVNAIITTAPTTISPLRTIWARLWVSAIFIREVSATSRVQVALALGVEVRAVGPEHLAREQDPGVADDVLPARPMRQPWAAESTASSRNSTTSATTTPATGRWSPADLIRSASSTGCARVHTTPSSPRAVPPSSSRHCPRVRFRTAPPEAAAVAVMTAPHRRRGGGSG